MIPGVWEPPGLEVPGLSIQGSACLHDQGKFRLCIRVYCCRAHLCIPVYCSRARLVVHCTVYCCRAYLLSCVFVFVYTVAGHILSACLLLHGSGIDRTTVGGSCNFDLRKYACTPSLHHHKLETTWKPNFGKLTQSYLCMFV